MFSPLTPTQTASYINHIVNINQVLLPFLLSLAEYPFLVFFFFSSPGEGNGNPLQYSCLENPRDRGAWWAIDHKVAKSWTRLSNYTFLSSSLFQPKFKPENVQSSFIFRLTGSWTSSTPLCKIPDPNNKVQGFPGGPLVKSLPCNAGDTSSIPGPGRSLNAAEQLSLCPTTTEPMCHSCWALHA